MIKDAHQSVSQFVNQLKRVVSTHPNFRSVSIVGEISNFKAHHSGHFYFSLKDNQSRISCVMFKTSTQSVAFKPKDGDRVVITGRADVFEASGSVQIYVNSMIMDGVGALYIEYEKLRKDFESKGYFDPGHKKSIPLYPEKIGVITGEGSAAYRDITITLGTRWPVAQQIDLLAFVQGENAIKSIVDRLTYADTLNLDVIILGRGGGSIEDLWAFNAPEVVETIFNLRTPVITGIGHESDVTLADFVADIRGATPTAASVIATPDKVEIQTHLRNYKNMYYTRVRNTLMHNQNQFNTLVMQSKLSDPLQDVSLRQQRLDYYQSQLMKYHQTLSSHLHEVKAYPLQFSHQLMRRIEANKTNVNRLQDSMVMTHSHALKESQRNLMFIESSLLQKLHRTEKSMDPMKQQTVELERRILTNTTRSLNLKAQAFKDIIKTIDKLEPTKRLNAIFGQGFGRISINNEVQTSINLIKKDDRITVEMRDGFLEANVIGKEVKDDKNI